MLYKNAYKQLCSLSATFLLILFLSANFSGAPGDLDLSFGSGGRVLSTNFLGYAVAIQSDGKIVAVGSTGVFPFAAFTWRDITRTALSILLLARAEESLRLSAVAWLLRLLRT